MQVLNFMMVAEDISLSLYLGTGGPQPGVHHVPASGAPAQLAQTASGQSVYALRLSPEGRRLVAGTRNRASGDQCFISPL